MDLSGNTFARVSLGLRVFWNNLKGNMPYILITFWFERNTKVTKEEKLIQRRQTGRSNCGMMGNARQHCRGCIGQGNMISQGLGYG